MATFPAGLYSHTTLVDNTDDVLAAHPNTLGAEIEAIEAKVGVDGSAVATSHDYLLSNLPAQDGTTVVTNLNADLIDGLEAAALTGFSSGDFLFTTNTGAKSGWTDRSSTWADKYVRVHTTASSTGGNNTHTHPVGSYAGSSHGHSITGNTGSTTYNTCSDDGGACNKEAMTTHSHTAGSLSASGAGVTITGSSGNNTADPAYVTVRVYEKN